jgi:hypothetical protein
MVPQLGTLLRLGYEMNHDGGGGEEFSADLAFILSK